MFFGTPDTQLCIKEKRIDIYNNLMFDRQTDSDLLNREARDHTEKKFKYENYLCKK